MVVARAGGEGAHQRCGGFRRRTLTRLAEFIVAMTPSAAMMLALLAGAGFTGGCGRSAIRGRRLMAVTLMTVAIVTRPALFRATAGPPDLDQFRRGGCFGRGDRFSRRFSIDRLLCCFSRCSLTRGLN